MRPPTRKKRKGIGQIKLKTNYQTNDQIVYLLNIFTRIACQVFVVVPFSLLYGFLSAMLCLLTLLTSIICCVCMCRNLCPLPIVITVMFFVFAQVHFSLSPVLQRRTFLLLDVWPHIMLLSVGRLCYNMLYRGKVIHNMYTFLHKQNFIFHFTESIYREKKKQPNAFYWPICLMPCFMFIPFDIFRFSFSIFFHCCKLFFLLGIYTRFTFADRSI